MGLTSAGIDMSGKIDEKYQDTAVVYCPMGALTPNHTIYVPNSVSRNLINRIKPQYARHHSKSAKWFGPKLFAVCLFYLLKGALNDIRSVHMEEEYPGHMDRIMDALDGWFQNTRTNFSRDKFVYPTDRKKDFKAHTLANMVRKQQREPHRELDYEDFEKYMALD